MNLRSLFGLAAAIPFSFSLACSGPTNGPSDEMTSALQSSVAMMYSLPGYAARMLVVDDAGVLQIVTVGEASSRVPVATSAVAAPPRAGRTLAGLAYLLLDDGRIVQVDPASASVVRTVPTRVRNAADLALVSPSVGFVTSHADGKLRKVDPTSGKAIGTLDLAPGNAASAASLGRMALVGTKLYVQIERTGRGTASRGAVAIVDTDTLRLRRVLELSGHDPREPSRALEGIAPGGSLVLDPRGKFLYVTALGARPADTGGLFRIDLATDTLDAWAARANAGFQGPLALGPAGESFVVYHTSTPVASTHLFRAYTPNDPTPPGEDNEALLDAFEEVEELPTTDDRALFALPISCPAGFCVGGAGITFVSTKDGVVHPRLLASELGGKPELVLFL